MTVDGGSLVIDGGLGKTYNIGTLTIKRGKLTIRNAVVNIDNLIIYGDSEYDGLWINSSAKVNVNMYADVTGGYNRLFTLWKKQGGTLSVSGTLNVNRDLTIEKGGNFTQNAGSIIKVNGNVEFTSCYAPALKGGTLWVRVTSPINRRRLPRTAIIRPYSLEIPIRSCLLAVLNSESFILQMKPITVTI